MNHLLSQICVSVEIDLNESEKIVRIFSSLMPLKSNSSYLSLRMDVRSEHITTKEHEDISLNFIIN